MVGATSTLWRQKAEKGTWLAALIARKKARHATIALANKMARVAWAILAKGGVYRQTAIMAT